VWPWIIEHPFRIGSYGLMMAVGFLTSWVLLAKDLRRRGLDPSLAEGTIFLGVLAGLLGAKLAYLWTEAPAWEWSELWSGSGLTWHGGLILAALLITAYYLWHRLPLGVMADAVAPLLASGYAFGRIGCQLAGDGDYGVACAAGWWRDHVCMAYPNGIVPSPCEVAGRYHEVCPITPADVAWLPVHPTPVYEALGGFALFAVLWGLRKHVRRPGMLFAAWGILAGLSRFAVEFIRLSEDRPDRWLGLRDAQWVALGMVALGLVVAGIVTVRGRPSGASGAA
jgi:phosphatidylglycerol---prolipoprotein diacylglyceryl transferase